MKVERPRVIWDIIYAAHSAPTEAEMRCSIELLRELCR